VTVALGATGLEVGPIGLGAGQLGDDRLAEADAARLLDAALELGVTLIDTARSYGTSEPRLGRLLAGRRARVVLSTKVGYDIAGHADWTGPCVAAGIDRALGELRTDRIDLVHLHSCPREVLVRGEVIDALLRARDAGKLRVAAYSGDNDALAHAATCGAFGSLQCSLSICDQWALEHVVAEARAAGLGVIAKRALANAAWCAPESPYAERWRLLALELELPPHEAAVRFAAHSTGAHAILVGTRSPEHVAAAVEAAARGPLPAATVEAIRTAYRRFGWPGVI